MTVRLLRPFEAYPANSVVSLDRGTEAALVSQLAASTEFGNGVPWSPNSPYDVAPENAVNVALTGNPSLDFDALQSALKVGGVVRVMTPGTYVIPDSLIVYSRTALYIGPGVNIVMAPGAGGRPVLQNYAFTQRNNRTNVTITWSAGTSATVTWANHGLVVGDSMWLQGSTLSVFNLVATVLSVTDANTVAIQLNYVPSGAPSGQATAVKCDRDITLQCDGLIDYNWPLNTTGTSNINSCAVNMGLIQNFRVFRLNVARAEKYALHTGAIRDGIIMGLHCPITNSDILHMYGPQQNVQAIGISGNNGDDGVVVHPYEAPGFPNFQWTRGDCIGVRVRGTNIRTALAAGAICVAYPNDVDRLFVSFEDVGGRTLQGEAVRVNASNSANDVADYVYINGVSAQCRFGVQINRSASNVCTVRKLEIVPTTFQPQLDSPSTGIPILISTACVVLDGDVGVNITEPSFGNGAAQFAVQATGTYRRLVVRGFINGGATGRAVNIATAQTGHLIVSMEQRTGDGMIGGSLVSGNITLFHCDTQIPQIISTSGTSGTINVNLHGNRFNNASGGIVRSTTGTFNVRSAGNNVIEGTSVPVVAPSGTPVFNVYGFDLALDPIAVTTLGATNGQYCTSTQAGVEGGPAVRTPAGWVALGTGASGVNTVIT